MPQAKQVINGTWGEVWINGEYVSEVSALQAKVTLTKVDVNFTRDLWKRSRLTFTILFYVRRFMYKYHINYMPLLY